MNPIEFAEQTQIINKNNEGGFRPLPLHFDKLAGDVISKWEMSDEEFEEFSKTRTLFISMRTFGQPPFAILPSVSWRFGSQEWLFAMLYYQTEDRKKSAIIWMKVDAMPPENIIFNGEFFVFAPSARKPYTETKPLIEVGFLYFRYPTPEEMAMRKEVLMQQFEKIKDKLPEEQVKSFYQNLDEENSKLPILVEKLAGFQQEKVHL